MMGKEKSAEGSVLRECWSAPKWTAKRGEGGGSGCIMFYKTIYIWIMKGV